jgi:hypothetical protein
MIAHGFGLEFLADLVTDGLAGEKTERVEMDRGEIEIVRLRITTTPAGKAMFGMLGVFADLERSIAGLNVLKLTRKTTRTGPKNKQRTAHD